MVFKTLDRLGELLRMAASAVSQAERDAEFGREIRSYWGQQLRHTTDFQLVLAELPPGAVPLFAFSEPQQKQGIQTVVLGTQQEGIRETSTRLGLGTGKIRDPATAGFFLPLASIPSVRLPTPYRLLDWLRPACAPTDLAAVEAWLAAEAHPTRFLVLRLPNAGGTPVFQPLILRSSGLGKARPLNLGRRAGRRAPSVPLAGPLAGISDVLLHVMAPEVVHSRALEAPGKLAHAHIVLVGVGTLGGAMAVNLARAGVGRLTLVDPDNLEADNLGRHPLGARELGQKKAEALARRLYEDVPTVEVSAIPTHVQWGGQKAAEALAAASLVLVSSADWRSELWLWELKRSGVAWAMVQVWSEPHAVAGTCAGLPFGVPGRSPRALRSQWGVSPLLFIEMARRGRRAPASLWRVLHSGRTRGPRGYRGHGGAGCHRRARRQRGHAPVACIEPGCRDGRGGRGRLLRSALGGWGNFGNPGKAMAPGA